MPRAIDRRRCFSEVKPLLYKHRAYNSNHKPCWFDGKVLNKFVGSNDFDVGIDYRVCYAVSKMSTAK